jgi:predicted ABC-type ATPase
VTPAAKPDPKRFIWKPGDLRPVEKPKKGGATDTPRDEARHPHHSGDAMTARRTAFHRQVNPAHVGGATDAAWDESKHARDKGKFSSTPGAAGAGKPPGGPKEPAKDPAQAQTAPGPHGAPAGGKKPDTEAMFKGKDGQWAPERQALHKAYTEAVTKGLPTSSDPVVHMTGGGPASGKSTAILNNPKAGIPDKTKAAHIDPDGAKAGLPEYQEGVKNKDLGAAAHVHEESSHMAKQSIGEALGKGHDVVYDSVGDSGIDKLAKKVDEMRKAGAKKVEMQYVIIDPEEAISRSDKRAAKSGRFVPHEFIRQAHKDVAKTSAAALDKGLFDGMRIWDNSGKEPTLVLEHVKGQDPVIHDRDAYNRWRELGK